MKNPRERIITAILLLLFVFALFSVIVFSTSDISVSAKSASLYEPKTKSFLYTKNSNERLPMASTTKIMTALVAIENYPIENSVTVHEDACGTEGSSLYLKPGEVFQMKDLLYGLMLRSANDAASAIAYAVSGGIDAFSDLMNKKAAELSLKDTHFKNPHGLDDKEHYTTAHDLAIISACALENPIFKEIVSTYKKTIKNSLGEERLIVNHNKLLRLYDGAIGVKTGFTKKSGRCLVGAAEKCGLTFITVTIDAPDDWNDHIRLFDKGFSTLKLQKLASVGEFCYNIPVIGSEKSTVCVKNEDEFSTVVNISDENVNHSVHLSRYTAAPIKKGDILGKVIFSKNGSYIGEINLYAQEDANLERSKNPIIRFFKQ